ncbi:hypothetical protein COO60DRAFT_1542740 [Scenedesmus sp. NREL 46B-D3]|nr:hypothetical protein COO60DRAFT_1542740 [Scenedesmus sp. NREL 46B-D3]
MCGSAQHLGLVIGGGVPGLLWVFGLPLALGLTLRRHNRMENEEQQLASERIELQYGLMYDKYRYSCYYWETILLIENCLLTLLLVLLQGQPPALQVLCAMAVIFIEAVLHVTFKPYACRMLDTLRRVSVFGLMATLFLIMLVSLSQFEQQDRVNLAAMGAIVAVNCCVLCLYLWAAFSELVRWVRSLLDKDNKGYVSKQDVQVVLQQAVQALQQLAVRFGLPVRRQQAAVQALAAPGSRNRRPPQEQAIGSVYTVNQSADASREVRSGNVVVVNPTQLYAG